jgi:uncharacterized repeat protein (TIGR03803 family)
MFVGTALASSPSESVIYSFTSAFSNPVTSLVADSAGNLYGTALDGTKYPNGAVFELSPNSNGGWSEKTLVTFNGTNGSLPQSTMVVDSNGNLYGSTALGGNGPCTGTPRGCGVVFELSPPSGGSSWTYTILYNFQGGNDGTGPGGNLVMDGSGNLYGTTGPAAVGATNGTVWELKAPAQGGTWTQKTLYTFNGTDGFTPNSLTLKDGALYGTTAEGGSSSYAGTVFELKPSAGTWNYTQLYAFNNGSDGGFPFSVIGSATSGNLYGTTSQGGQYNWGTVFKLTPNSNGTWAESVIYNFTGGADGATPESPLIRDKSDNLYGTTDSGGLTTECSFSYPYDGCGVVFKVVPSTGAETVLHAFSDTGSDGNVPFSSGVIFSKGDLYGTTEYGGTGGCVNYNGTVVNCGTVYQIKP